MHVKAAGANKVLALTYHCSFHLRRRSNGQRRKRKPEQDLTDTKNFDFHVNNLINFLTGPSSVVPQQASLELAVLVKIRILASKHPTHINVQHCLAAMQFRCMLFKDMFNQYQFVRSLAPGDVWVLANFTAKLQSGFGKKVLVEAQTKEGNKIVGFKRSALNKDGTHNVHLVQDESVVHAIISGSTRMSNRRKHNTSRQQISDET